MRCKRLEGTVTDVHFATGVDHHDAFQRHGEAVRRETPPRLVALQWQARDTRCAPVNPAHGTLAQSAGAVVEEDGRIHASKFGHPAPYLARMNIATLRRGVGVALSALLATSLQAQTLTQPNLPDHGFTFTYGVTNVQPEGFDWSTAFSIQNVNFDFIPTDSTAYADAFSASDFAQQVPAPNGGVNLSYFGYTESGMDFWGGVDATGVQVVHPEPLRFVPYPFTLGDVHSDSLAFEFSAGGLNVARHMSIDMEVLAGGTMLLPGELSFENTLQVAQTQWVLDSTVASTGGVLIEGVAYWTQDMPVPVAQTYTYSQVVAGDTSVLFVGAEFLVNATAGFQLPQPSSLSAFPSPASSSLTVSGEAGSWVRVMDVQGREVMRRQLVSDQETWDVSGWPVGMHFLNVEGTRRTVRVLVTR